MAFKLNGATLKNMAKTTGKFIEKNAPAIAAGAALATMVAAVVSAIKAGPEVAKALEDAEIKKNEQALKERMEDGSDETPIVDLTWKERGLIYAKYYWKTVLMMLLSAGSMVASVHFGNKKIRALAVLAAAAESNLDQLENAVKAVVGEKKFEQIRGQLIDKQIEDNPPEGEAFVANTHNGDQLCYEPVFGTYYWSDISAVDKAYNDYMGLYLTTQQVVMEDLYNLLGIPKNFVPKYAGKVGHMRDEEEGIVCEPKATPRSVPVTLNGKKYTAYVMDIEEPKSYDELVNEQLAKRQFRQFR